jgi:hypothetical protein
VVRWSLAAGAAALAVVLFVVLRPGGDDEEQTTTARRVTSVVPPAPARTQRAESRRPQITQVGIVVRGGSVVGGVRRATVEKGRRVVIAVTSSVSDEVHLHGYDRSVRVAPGRPARLAFRATLVGVFEVELEERGLQIAEIEVRP